MLPLKEWDDRFEAVISQSSLGFSEVIAATKIKGDLFRLEWQPLDTPGLFFGDIVSVEKVDGELLITAVVKNAPLVCKIVLGLPITKQGRDLFEKISILGKIAPTSHGEFTINATKENMSEIEKILHEAGIQTTDFWWNDPEILKAAHEKAARIQERCDGALQI